MSRFGEADLRRLVEWYTTRETALSEGLLSEDLVFESQVYTIGRTDLLLQVENSEPWRSTTVSAVVIEGSRAMVMFQGIDPVTELRHCVGWFIEHAEGRVDRIVVVEVATAGA